MVVESVKCAIAKVGTIDLYQFSDAFKNNQWFVENCYYRQQCGSRGRLCSEYDDSSSDWTENNDSSDLWRKHYQHQCRQDVLHPADNRPLLWSTVCQQTCICIITTTINLYAGVVNLLVHNLNLSEQHTKSDFVDLITVVGVISYCCVLFVVSILYFQIHLVFINSDQRFLQILKYNLNPN